MEIFIAHIPGVDQWKTTLTRGLLLLLLLLMVLTWRMKTIENHISGATQRSLASTRWTWATLNEPGLQSSHLSIIHRCLNYLTLNELDGAFNVKHWVTQLMLYTGEKLSSPIFCLWVSEWVCQASVTPDQISTFSNIYRHTSPLLTMNHLISSSTNLYWPSTS